MIASGKEPVNVVKSVDSCGRLPLFAKACPERQIRIYREAPLRRDSRRNFEAERSARWTRVLHSESCSTWDSQGKFKLTLSDLENWTTLEADAWGWMLMHDFILELAAGLPNLKIVNYDELCNDPLEKSNDLATVVRP